MSKPISAGSLLSSAFRIWSQNLVAFVGVMLVFSLPGLVLSTALVNPKEPNYPVQGLISLISWVLGSIATAAITYGVLQQLRGQKPDIGSCVKQGLARVGAVMGVGLLFGLGVGLGTLLCLVPGMMLLTMWMVAIPATVVEHTGVTESLKRSSTLTEGHRWSLFFMILAVGALQILMVGVVVGITMSGGDAQTRAVGLIMALGGVVVQSLGAVAFTVAYHDLRALKEGTDVETLMKVFA
jgi:hypothetical protein